ncbi:hypothetical protein B0H14DRAFT_2590113 [Mycena olivaceomarginata]|nr:hypothetical protein B0H14DRAFT_2590113 [Mycena olivaceomarginata]
MFKQLSPLLQEHHSGLKNCLEMEPQTCAPPPSFNIECSVPKLELFGMFRKGNSKGAAHDGEQSVDAESEPLSVCLSGLRRTDVETRYTPAHSGTGIRLGWILREDLNLNEQSIGSLNKTSSNPLLSPFSECTAHPARGSPCARRTTLSTPCAEQVSVAINLGGRCSPHRRHRPQSQRRSRRSPCVRVIRGPNELICTHLDLHSTVRARIA